MIWTCLGLFAESRVGLPGLHVLFGPEEPPGEERTFQVKSWSAIESELSLGPKSPGCKKRTNQPTTVVHGTVWRRGGRQMASLQSLDSLF